VLGMATVPVGLGISGLTPADGISVEPSGMPVGETGELDADALPSGEVAPTEGVGATMPVTCATATWQVRSAGRITASLVSVTGVFHSYQDGPIPGAAFVWAHGQKSSGRLTTMGFDVLRTTTQRKGCTFDGLISMCGRKAGT
jgi:hypothetical protein